MLCGNVYSKLDSFKDELQFMESNYIQSEEDKRLMAATRMTMAALEKAKPQPIPFEELDFNLGERWIPSDIYNRFADWIFKYEPKEDGTVWERTCYSGKEELARELAGEGRCLLQKGDRLCLVLYREGIPVIYYENVRTGATGG